MIDVTIVHGFGHGRDGGTFTLSERSAAIATAVAVWHGHKHRLGEVTSPHRQEVAGMQNEPTTVAT